jgi:acyl-CoA thioesterase-1
MKWNLFALASSLVLASCGSDSAQNPEGRNEAHADAPLPDAVSGRERRILALGDSLLAGFGLNAGQGYPERLEAALRARGINARIANAGISGDTSAGGLQRLQFTLDNQPSPPDVAILSLGGNDVLRGLPPEETRANLDAIITTLKARGIQVILLGMLAPPNLGADYRRAFDPIYPDLAKKHQAVLVPFFLQPVLAKPDLVQADRIHPTAKGVDAMVAATLDSIAGALPQEEEAQAAR